MLLIKSWKESPKVPAGWEPKDPPGAVEKHRIKNFGLLKALRAVKPGSWHKIYHRGKDGSSIHYCQHASGEVFDVEHHP